VHQDSKFLHVNQEQVIWWLQSYRAWLGNNHRQILIPPQLPKPAKASEMENFEEDNQDKPEIGHSPPPFLFSIIS